MTDKRQAMDGQKTSKIRQRASKRWAKDQQKESKSQEKDKRKMWAKDRQGLGNSQAKNGQRKGKRQFTGSLKAGWCYRKRTGRREMFTVENNGPKRLSITPLEEFPNNCL